VKRTSSRFTAKYLFPVHPPDFTVLRCFCILTVVLLFCRPALSTLLEVRRAASNAPHTARYVTRAQSTSSCI
jgi:hypothetical protein